MERARREAGLPTFSLFIIAGASRISVFNPGVSGCTCAVRSASNFMICQLNREAGSCGIRSRNPLGGREGRDEEEGNF
jgi:hypothetical protein